MNNMIDVIEELKGCAARIESVVDDLESDVNEQGGKRKEYFRSLK